MFTKVVKIREDYKIEESYLENSIIEEMGQAIKAGELVAFPTETVYGLGGNALDALAAAKIYEAKGRPSDNPLIIHIAKWEDIYRIGKEIPEKAKKLADAFWPGPLTMIVKKTDQVPLETTGGLDTVAVRLPSHLVAREIIKAAGGYVAAPSANRSGRPSPTLASHVIEDMEGRISYIVDGGEVGIGLESTIVDLTEEIPVILRPGSISLEMIREVIGATVMDLAIEEPMGEQSPKAPGMKYRHYAPSGSLEVVQGEEEAVIAYINRKCKEYSELGKVVGVLCSEETQEAYEGAVIKVIGSREDGASVAKGLYRVLRECDADGLEILYAESYHSMQMGQAIMNRLLKAAGHNIINVE